MFNWREPLQGQVCNPIKTSCVSLCWARVEPVRARDAFTACIHVSCGRTGACHVDRWANLGGCGGGAAFQLLRLDQTGKGTLNLKINFFDCFFLFWAWGFTITMFFHHPPDIPIMSWINYHITLKRYFVRITLVDIKIMFVCFCKVVFHWACLMTRLNGYKLFIPVV